MDISPERIAAVWNEYQRRIEAIRMVGGISALDVANGATVPKGWVGDLYTDYYVPPEFFISTTVQ